MEVHPIIKQLLEHGIPVKLSLKEFGRGRHPISGSEGMGLLITAVVYVVDGFYKAGTVWLEPQMFFDGETPKTGFVAHHTKYNTTKSIRSLEDIVSMNYGWWLRDRAEGEVAPNPSWVKLYEKFGMVKKETVTRYVPTKGIPR